MPIWRQHLLAFAAPLLLCAPASAWNPLEHTGGGSNQAYVDPDGYYQVVIPGGFDCAQKKGFLGSASSVQRRAKVVACRGTRGAAASLVFTVRSVPRSATPEMVALNEADRMKKKEDHFKEIERRTLQLAGTLDAVMIRYRYNRFGNIQHPMQVVALYATAKGRLFEVRYESREDQVSRYQEDLEAVFASFRPAQLDDAGKPILPEKREKKKKAKTDEEFVNENKYLQGQKRF